MLGVKEHEYKLLSGLKTVLQDASLYQAVLPAVEVEGESLQQEYKAGFLEASLLKDALGEEDAQCQV